MAFPARSGFPKRRAETIKSLMPGVLIGVCIGICITLSFVKVMDSPRTPAVNCTSLPPRGAESLPRGIVVPSTDLYPRRLWGKPEEDLLLKPKYLLTLTVGLKQKEFVNQCVQKFSKEWQILLFHYDGKVSEWDDLDWAKYAIRISTSKQAKWWYAKRFLHPDVVEAYDYIFIWDEDLDVEHFNAEKYMGLVKRYGLEISQPGLEPDRGLTWEMTKRRGDSEVHKDTKEKEGWCTDPLLPPAQGKASLTILLVHLSGLAAVNVHQTYHTTLPWFVEIMAPVFSRSAWRCVWHMIQNDLVHGWGLDMELQRCARPAHEKIGVVDAQWIRHRVVLSLNISGGEDPTMPKWAGAFSVKDRCKYEWEEYRNRLKLADLNEAAGGKGRLQ